MFKVRHKETGDIYTVYGMNGSMFLLYGHEWFYEYMGYFEPVEG